MDIEESITLLLKAAAAEDTSNRDARASAKLVVETLGCLALAIVQAGAVIRQGVVKMHEYCDVYAHHRKQLLSRQTVQASDQYKYTVYTTWEVSSGIIEGNSNETSQIAIELLQVFSFLHFEGISESIFKNASTRLPEQGLPEASKVLLLGLLRQTDADYWNPFLFRESVNILTSFSLVTVEESNGYISMHPLVHAWARDRMTEAEQKQAWIRTTLLIMTSLTSSTMEMWNYEYYRYLLPHLDACLLSHENDFVFYGLRNEPIPLRFPFCNSVQYLRSFPKSRGDDGKRTRMVQNHVRRRSSTHTDGDE